MQRTMIGRSLAESVVYFIEAKGVDRVKIGWTKNLSLRMKEYITGCPVDLEALFTLPGGAAEEHALHMRFRKHRVRGEWFVLSEIQEALFELCNASTPIASFCARCTICGEPKRAGRRQDKVIDRPCGRCARERRAEMRARESMLIRCSICGIGGARRYSMQKEDAELFFCDVHRQAERERRAALRRYKQSLAMQGNQNAGKSARGKQLAHIITL
jgi:hypothetical protein